MDLCTVCIPSYVSVYVKGFLFLSRLKAILSTSQKLSICLFGHTHRYGLLIDEKGGVMSPSQSKCGIAWAPPAVDMAVAPLSPLVLRPPLRPVPLRPPLALMDPPSPPPRLGREPVMLVCIAPKPALRLLRSSWGEMRQLRVNKVTLVACQRCQGQRVRRGQSCRDSEIIAVMGRIFLMGVKRAVPRLLEGN